MTISLNGTTGIQFPDSSLQTAAASPYVLKNRLINGDFRIDQRNAGASVTPSTLYNTYTLDRWNTVYSVASKFSIQRNAGSITPPVGFTNYLGATSLSAYTVGASEQFNIQQVIEGFNIADLGWGTANAKTVTLSFWAYSSLTGTFGGVVQNGSNARTYPFTYTISSANTWTQISVTIVGDTSGTWTADNSAGLSLRFNLGAGATVSGTAGSWSGSTYYSATGATSVVGTNGATFYITGVQLEQNTSATPFERRLYGQELANCQRYFEVISNLGANYSGGGVGAATSTTQAFIQIPLKVNKRATPSLSFSTAGNFILTNNTNGALTVTSLALDTVGPYTISCAANVASGLTAGNATRLLSFGTTDGSIYVSAEL